MLCFRHLLKGAPTLQSNNALLLGRRSQAWAVRWLLWAAMPLVLGCTASSTSPTAASSSADRTKEPPQVTVQVSTSAVDDRQNKQLLADSWKAYKERFIQQDGRVIDWENKARTVSEGQAYAMLRAVLADDPDTFETTLNWAENNLRRSPTPNDADDEDFLWAWLWGERSDGSWGIQDANFASDADIDAITALIWAARRWDRPDYLELAIQKLDDLWNQSTLIALTSAAPESRYLLPGPLAAFEAQPGKVYLNPSYLAPYAFRLFAEVDPNADRDWMQLVDSSYQILEQTNRLSQAGLPADWVLLDLTNQEIQAIPSGQIHQSQYGFDAYRTWWRVAWDAARSDDVRAQTFLENHLSHLQRLWTTQGSVPAVMTLSGDALVDYEATSQYAMLYLAFQERDPGTAQAIRNQKLLTTYNEGIWDDPDAYYVQNLAWLGLFPADDIPSISSN